METELKKEIQQLRSKVEALEKEYEQRDKTNIKIVGTFDGTNVPVTVQGVRRKIATVAP